MPRHGADLGHGHAHETDEEVQFDSHVVVVGAGPVGLLLAIELRLGGVDVTVIEQRTTPMRESRASVLDARSMELLAQRGIVSLLGTPPHSAAGHFAGLPLDLTHVPSPFAGQWFVPQFQTEEALADRAYELGVEVRRGWAVGDVSVGSEGVTVKAVGAAGRLSARAAYVVGCDGSASALRVLGGFETQGTGATRELFRADVVDVDVAPRRFARSSHGLANAVRRDDGTTRIMVHEFGAPVRSRAEAPTYSEVAAVWKRVVGEDIGHGTPIWVDSFDDTTQQVTTYRAGRILLAGDAAHTQPPIGGQGLNLGLQDAVNLGWKLAAQVRGEAPDGLLDTYHRERHQAGADALSMISAQALLLFGGPETDPLRSVMSELLELGPVQEFMARTLSGVGVRYSVDGGDHPLLGTRLSGDEVRIDGGEARSGWSSDSSRGVLWDISNGCGHERSVLDRWAGRVTAVRAWRTDPQMLPGVEAVLVRPDGHIAWVDTGGDDPTSALCRWFGDPASST